jgi:uncharacterized protein
MGFGVWAAARSAAILASVFFCLIALSPAARAGQTLERVEFVTGSGSHAFRVEVADTPEQRAKGLMFRRSMPQDQGMLFDFDGEVPVMMWMKNTYIPLDMVFLSRKGVVTNIAADTTPMSEAVIYGGRASAVIELNAGVAKQIGLKPGDTVRHPAFKP